MDEPSIVAAGVLAGGTALGWLSSAALGAMSAATRAKVLAAAEADPELQKLAKRSIARRERQHVRARLGYAFGLAMCAVGASGLASSMGWSVWGTVLGAVTAACTLFEFSRGILRRRPTTSALRALRVLAFPLWAMEPLAMPLAYLSRGNEPSPETAPSASEARVVDLQIERVIEQGEAEGAIEEERATLLRSVIGFKDTDAADVMVPRPHVVAFEVSTPVAEVLEVIVKEGHSRYPIYRERLDQIVGVLYAKDIFGQLDQGRELTSITLAELVRRSVLIVREDDKVDLLLKRMQMHKVHLAIVADEFGGTSGVLTLEDIVEEIVGEIEDEHDDETAQLTEIAPGRYVADATMSLHDVATRLGFALDRDLDYDSLGGMVIGIAGRVPEVGESVSADAFDLLVRRANELSVTEVEIAMHPPAAE